MRRGSWRTGDEGYICDTPAKYEMLRRPLQKDTISAGSPRRRESLYNMGLSTPVILQVTEQYRLDS